MKATDGIVGKYRVGERLSIKYGLTWARQSLYRATAKTARDPVRWYDPLTKFPSVLWDDYGYLPFWSKQALLSAEKYGLLIHPCGQITVRDKANGISAIPGYVWVVDSPEMQIRI
jgi:hypothetical protein